MDCSLCWLGWNLDRKGTALVVLCLHDAAFTRLAKTAGDWVTQCLRVPDHHTKHMESAKLLCDSYQTFCYAPCYCYFGLLTFNTGFQLS